MNRAAMAEAAVFQVDDTRTMRVLCAAACCVFVAAPFVSVRFPPVTDLPQHLAQIRLFLDAWRHPDGPYRIQWFTPYNLAYALVGVVWGLTSAAVRPRLALLPLALLWVGAVHLLAARRGRAALAAVLLSTLFFSQDTYWGFISFQAGWVAFVVWFLLVTRRPRGAAWTEAPLFFAAAAVLYFSHVLWLLVALGWLAIDSVAFPPPRRRLVLRALGVLPVCLATAVWYPHLGARGFTSPTIWEDTPSGRLSFSWVVDAAFGGLHGPTEAAICVVLAAWIAAALWQRRERLSSVVDHRLALAGAFLLALALLLPDEYQNTVVFAARWFPCALILLLLAVPAPAFNPRLLRLGTMAVAAAFSLATCAAWMRFDRVDLSGLPQALAALPPQPRVLGLSFLQRSDVIKGRPFIQTFAYAQVRRGGELSFSFAQFAPSLVIYKQPRGAPWTGVLEWFPERVRPADFRFFDYVLVNATAAAHARVAAQFPLQAVTHDGRWRLYRVRGSA